MSIFLSGDKLSTLPRNGETQKSADEVNLIDFKSEPPSLQNISLVFVVIKIWTELHEDKKLPFTWGETQKYYQDLEIRVSNKIKKMSLPSSLKVKVSNISSPIGMQLVDYFYFGKNFDFGNLSALLDIGGVTLWTMEGTIDSIKILKELINSEDKIKDFNMLYKLTCECCLEENIRNLWEKVPPEIMKKYFSTYWKYECHMISYWNASLSNELSSFLRKIKQNDPHNIYDCSSSIHQNMTSVSAYVGNTFAFKYFWQKLTPSEKHVTIERFFPYVVLKCYNEYQYCDSFADILCFMLSEVNDKNQRISIYQNYSERILSVLFYTWPYQKFFIPAFSLLIDYLHEDEYVSLMLNISNEIQQERTTEGIFKEVWSRSPLKFKKRFLKGSKNLKESIVDPIWKLLLVGDVKTVDIIVRTTSVEEKRRIGYDLFKYYEFTDLVVSDDKWNLLNTLISKLIQSDDDVKSFKKRVIMDNLFALRDLIVIGDFDRIDKIINWAFQSQKEIQQFKNSIIDPIFMYAHLLRLRNNGFPNWYFKSEIEINTFQENFEREHNIKS